MKTRDEARALLDAEAQRYPRPAQLHLSLRPLRPAELRLARGDLEPDERPHPRGSWVALLDLDPDDPAAHACRVLLVDPDGTLRGFDGRWFPGDASNVFRADSPR